MKMATGRGGLSGGLGGFASQLVILFEYSAALERFLSEGLDATAQVGTVAGDEKDRLALGLDDGKALFVRNGRGWKIAAKLAGLRYRPDDELDRY